MQYEKKPIEIGKKSILSKYHLSRIVSVVMAIVLVMTVCVFADTPIKDEYPPYTGQSYIGLTPNTQKSYSVLEGDYSYQLTSNRPGDMWWYTGSYFTIYMPASIKGAGVQECLMTVTGSYDNQYGDFVVSNSVNTVGSNTGVYQGTINEEAFTPIKGCEIVNGALYFTGGEYEYMYRFNVSFGRYDNPAVRPFYFNIRNGRTASVRVTELIMNGVYLIGEEQAPIVVEPRYYTYRIPFGTRVHFDIVGGRTAQVNVNTPTREGNYLSKPDFNSIKWSFTGGAGTKAEWYAMLPVELEGYGDKSLLGGYSKFRSEWVTTGDTMNVCYYATSSNVKSDYYVTVTIYAEAVRPVWYGAQTQTELSSGDLTAITNTGGAVTFASGNGSQSSPYIVQPTNSDGITINYGSIDYGVQNEADGIISGLVNSLKSLLGAPVDSMNEVITDGQGFFSAVSGMFDWLPVELKTPIIGALSTVVVIGVIKVLL